MPRSRWSDPQQPQMMRAIEDVESRIRARWPESTFAAHHGEDPEGVYLDVTVDADFWEVIDEIEDLQQQILFRRHMPLYVVPVLPAERIEQQWRQRTGDGRHSAQQTASG